MNKKRIVYSIFAILFGIFIFIFGGYDDSPGAQLIGAVVFIFGVAGLIKSKREVRLK